MGDMSDLPNFPPKSFFRRMTLMRWIVATFIALSATMMAWAEFPNNVEMTLRISDAASQVLSGQPVQYLINIKNNGDQTVRLSDMQVGIHMVEGVCINKDHPGKKSFSLPQNVMVGPNSQETIAGAMDVIAECDGKLSAEIFAVIQRDRQRLTIKRPGVSFDLL